MDCPIYPCCESKKHTDACHCDLIITYESDPFVDSTTARSSGSSSGNTSPVRVRRQSVNTQPRRSTRQYRITTIAWLRRAEVEVLGYQGVLQGSSVKEVTVRQSLIETSMVKVVASLLKVVTSFLKVMTLLAKVMTLKVMMSLWKIMASLLKSFSKVVTSLSYRKIHVSSRENITKDDVGYCNARHCIHQYDDFGYWPQKYFIP